MPFRTTSAGVPTAGTVLIISEESTWANLKGAHIQDPVPLVILNAGTVACRISGTSSTASGYPLPVAKEMVFNLPTQGDDLFAWTTAATTGTLEMFAGRQWL